MDRRYFLGSALATSALWRMRSARSQDDVVTRGAVVIGVDRAGDLKPLRAARTGAESVAAWLQAEGFTVKPFTDKKCPVTFDPIYKAVNEFVEAGTLEQLVIYFAGHGFISGTLSELWMLSDSPRNPNAAVSLMESWKYAEQCGIPNVVFISDACRSPANTLELQRMRGGVLFPGTTNPRTDSVVDQFLAARIGTSAYEAALAGDPSTTQGIFTNCLLEAFRKPYETMVRNVDGRPVIPNCRLRPYLETEVLRQAQALSIVYNQKPDCRTLSEEPRYIAHVSGPDRAPQPAITASLTDVAASEIWKRSGGIRTLGPDDETPHAPERTPALIQLSAASGFDQSKRMILQARGQAMDLLARSGFSVSGQRVAEATARSGVIVRFRNIADSNAPSSLLEVDLAGTLAASVALRFSDGSGTVVAALRDYVGSVLVGSSGVSNVSYVPSRNSPMRSAYESEAGKVDELRASVATAAQFGVFRFEGSRYERSLAAAAMADRTRILKGIDPTLGLYAAYAYDDAAMKNEVRSIREYMQMTLQVDLYDVAMLSGVLARKSISDWRSVVPFCPMLSQGWGLLRVNNVQMPAIVASASDYLRVSLWNTLSPAGMDIVEQALRSGIVG